MPASKVVLRLIDQFNRNLDASALLTGAVLEDGLLRIANTNSIKVKSNDDLGSLNKKLADSQVYTRLIQKQIHA